MWDGHITREVTSHISRGGARRCGYIAGDARCGCAEVRAYRWYIADLWRYIYRYGAAMGPPDLPYMQYDLIVSANVFHFVDYDTTFEHIWKLLAPGWWYIFVDYCREGWFVLIERAIRTFASWGIALDEQQARWYMLEYITDIAYVEKFRWKCVIRCMLWSDMEKYN